MMGHDGPRTDEKWRMRGARLLSGRSSIITATFLGDCVETAAASDESPTPTPAPTVLRSGRYTDEEVKESRRE